ncbi:MAG: hypothetical protein KatS3mg076_2166 [Candidatus Binatia bacterium]|nr:MAG: hypothetical protein KatS3mg076_2166 [Candidatus Binatia bacterium]
MNRRRVLLVGDIARDLRRRGLFSRFEAETAQDADEALEKLARIRFDLVLFVSRPPELNGLEFLRALRGSRPAFLPLRATPPDVPVVMISPDRYPAAIEHAKRLGAMACVPEITEALEISTSVLSGLRAS